MPFFMHHAPCSFEQSDHWTAATLKLQGRDIHELGSAACLLALIIVSDVLLFGCRHLPSTCWWASWSPPQVSLCRIKAKLKTKKACLADPDPGLQVTFI